MRVTVKLFAGARELAGKDAVEVDLVSPTTVENLRGAICAAYPALMPLLPHAMFAINTSYASDDTTIPADAEVACIPPVSGG